MRKFLTAVIVAACVLGEVALMYFAPRWARDDRDAWERLRDAHHCRIVRTEDPPAGIGTTPGQTVWACDDGELIVRNSQ